jgi:hypothetical protein
MMLEEVAMIRSRIPPIENPFLKRERLNEKREKERQRITIKKMMKMRRRRKRARARKKKRIRMRMMMLMREKMGKEIKLRAAKKGKRRTK